MILREEGPGGRDLEKGKERAALEAEARSEKHRFVLMVSRSKNGWGHLGEDGGGGTAA